VTDTDRTSEPGSGEPGPKDGSPARRSRWRQQFGGHVAGTVDALQRRYLTKDSAAVATLAQLRSALLAEPGSAYAVLGVTRVPQDHLDGRLDDEDPTDTEQAKHTALTLYALHQQSVHDKPMHVDGASLGSAVWALARAAESEQAVRRRFATLGTSTTYDEAAFHLRALVRQLRDKRIPIDYGLLADDLVTLCRPNGAERVRARWGRDYYRAISDATEKPEPIQPASPPSTKE
jgi:CRISPR system Cascade subunit CasB